MAPEYKGRIEELAQWAQATEAEIADLVADISPLQQKLAAARERLDLIRKLAALAEPPSQAKKSAAAGDAISPQARVADPPRPDSGDLEYHLDELLRKAGKPMHISEIRQGLINQAVPLPGRGDEANIILRLRRSPDRFSRTGRGTYASAALGLPSVAPTKRRRRVRSSRK